MWLHAFLAVILKVFMRLLASADFIQRVAMRLLSYFHFTLWLHAVPCISRPYFKGLNAALCIPRLYLKSLHAAPVVFLVILWLHAAPCLFKQYFKGLHAAPNLILKSLNAAPVVFLVYPVAPCSSMWLQAAPFGSMHL